MSYDYKEGRASLLAEGIEVDLHDKDGHSLWAHLFEANMDGREFATKVFNQISHDDHGTGVFLSKVHFDDKKGEIVFAPTEAHKG